MSPAREADTAATSGGSPEVDGSAVDRSEVDPLSVEVLTATVAKLRDELEGMRAAMRTRALIEQAKGMLMERHAIDTDEAFRRLATLSQHANIKLVDVAAALVDSPGTEAAAPGPPRTPPGRSAPPGRTEATSPGGERRSPTPGDLARVDRENLTRRWPKQAEAGTFGNRVRAQGRSARLRSELMAARTSDEMISALLRSLPENRRPTQAALAALDANGTLCMIGRFGMSGPVAARWQAVPVDLPLLTCTVVRTGEARWVEHGEIADGTTASADRPEFGLGLGLGLGEDWSVSALLPIAAVGGGAPAVLALTWSAATMPHRPEEPVRTELQRLASALGVAVQRWERAGHPGGPDGSRDPVPALLDVLYHPVLLATPGRTAGTSEEVADLVVAHANPAAKDPAGRALAASRGRSLAEVWPEAATDGLLAACARVLRTGVQAELADHVWGVTANGARHEARCPVRVTRYRDGVLVTWPDLLIEATDTVTAGPDRGRTRGSDGASSDGGQRDE